MPRCSGWWPSPPLLLPLVTLLEVEALLACTGLPATSNPRLCGSRDTGSAGKPALGSEAARVCLYVAPWPGSRVPIKSWIMGVGAGGSQCEDQKSQGGSPTCADWSPQLSHKLVVPMEASEANHFSNHLLAPGCQIPWHH